MKSPATNPAVIDTLIEDEFNRLLEDFGNPALPQHQYATLRGGFYAGVAAALYILNNEGAFTPASAAVLSFLTNELETYSPERLN
jgi:hypothetical protein